MFSGKHVVLAILVTSAIMSITAARTLSAAAGEADEAIVLCAAYASSSTGLNTIQRPVSVSGSLLGPAHGQKRLNDLGC